MRGKNRKLKKKNRVHRRLALALTVALLTGQGHVSALAEELGDVPPTEISDETTTDISDDDNIGDDNNVGDPDGDTEKDVENNGDTGDKDGEEDRPEQCVCGNRCSEDSVNTDCPVCAADYSTCAVKETEEILPEAMLENELTEEANIAAPTDEEATTYADDDNGIKYVITGDGEVKVGEQDKDTVSGYITIPETVEMNGTTYRVTRIEERAFRYCERLTGVEIPESVTSIGQQAFYDCSSLTSVKIPGSVTIIETSVFSGCSNLTSVEIPESVTRIWEHAFYGCSALTSVEIPESVTSIGSAAFYGCSALNSVKIPGSVTNIEWFAFSGCSSLTSVELPKRLTSISSDTFAGCSSLN
ncbi:MAG: leucine-rich repeat domain-containing protein, partial [Lachnospiraceae bacterium]|nr:leucine-rich repeat domain-containing protein [Lachnospiraceae bacterium]